MLDSKAKYRLIGAGLLVVSAAVLLPLILDGERPDELNVQVSVPQKPDFPNVEIKPVQPLAEIAEQAVAESANEIELIPVATDEQEPQAKAESRDVAAPEAEPVQASKTLAPVSDRWTLQVATFGKKDNAARTLKKLKDAGYPAYVMASKSLYKVFVGPELKREVSEKIKADVKKEFGLRGIVIKYSPN